VPWSQWPPPQFSDVVLALIAAGCFWVILAPTSPIDNAAAFTLLGAVLAAAVYRRRGGPGGRSS